MVKDLVLAGARIFKVDNLGRSCFDEAKENGHDDVVEWLINYCCQVTISFTFMNFRILQSYLFSKQLDGIYKNLIKYLTTQVKMKNNFVKAKM